MVKKDYLPPRGEFASLYRAIAGIECALGIQETEPRIHSPGSFEAIVERLQTISLHAVYLGFDRDMTMEELSAVEKTAIAVQKELCWRMHNTGRAADKST